MGRSDIINQRWADLRDENGVSFIYLNKFDRLVASIRGDLPKAVLDGKEKRICLWVKGGVDVNEKKGHYRPLLEIAINSGEVKTVSLLLKLGADWRQGVHQTMEDIPHWTKMIKEAEDNPEETAEDVAYYKYILKSRKLILRECLRARMPYKEELYAKALHPDRVAKWVALGVDDMMFGF